MIAPLHDLKSLKVHVRSIKEYVVEDGLRSTKEYSIVELIEGLLWLLPHPETITLASRNFSSKSLKVNYFSFCLVFNLLYNYTFIYDE